MDEHGVHSRVQRVNHNNDGVDGSKMGVNDNNRIALQRKAQSVCGSRRSAIPWDVVSAMNTQIKNKDSLHVRMCSPSDGLQRRYLALWLTRSSCSNFKRLLLQMPPSGKWSF
jgi:hypothetical protein